MGICLPCPFCWGEAEIREEHDHFWIDHKGCPADLGGFETGVEALAAWNRRASAMSGAYDEFLKMDDVSEDDLTECFRHHVLTTIGWLPFGSRPGKEKQMYEEGFKAGYRRCQSDNEPELGEADVRVIQLPWHKEPDRDFWRAEVIGHVYEVHDDELADYKKRQCQYDFEARIRSAIE